MFDDTYGTPFRPGVHRSPETLFRPGGVQHHHARDSYLSPTGQLCRSPDSYYADISPDQHAVHHFGYLGHYQDNRHFAPSTPVNHLLEAARWMTSTSSDSISKLASMKAEVAHQLSQQGFETDPSLLGAQYNLGPRGLDAGRGYNNLTDTEADLKCTPRKSEAIHHLSPGDSKVVKLCAVCGDRASGVHYKVMTCEGCKGFWRRSIQRGSANNYRCKTGSDRCPVNTKARSRCQKCRFTACLQAGMMADLVMSDKERLSRSRLVHINREKRKGTAAAAEEFTDDDRLVINTMKTVFSEHLYNTYGMNGREVYARCDQFSSALMDKLTGGGAENDQPGHKPAAVPGPACEAVFYLYLAYTVQPDCLQAAPQLARLSAFLQTAAMGQDELEMCLSLLAVRPRLSWRLEQDPDRLTAWTRAMQAVKRKCATTVTEKKGSFISLFQAVQMASSLSNMLNISNILDLL